jgi:hypothetical protein
LVRVAAKYLPRCGHYTCCALVTRRVIDKPLCDAHAAEWEAEILCPAVDTADGPAIRRLIASGLLK